MENPGSRARRRGLALPVVSEPAGRRTHGRTVSRRPGCATGSAALGGVVVLSPPATTTKRTTAVGRAWPTTGEVHASHNRVSRKPRATVGVHVYYTEKLIECKQEAREDVESYATRFRTLVYELLEADPATLSEGMQVQHFKNGLRHEFRVEIMRLERYTAPNSLDKAEEAARVGEKIWKAGAKAASECLAVGTGAQHTRNRRTSIDQNRREAARTTSRDRSDAPDLEMIIRTKTRLLEELVEHQRGIRESLDKQSRALEQLKPAPKRCDYCNKKEHTIEQCYRRRNELEKTKREGDQTVAGAVHSFGNGRGDEMQIDGITVGGGRPTRILFDSGAEVSLVSRDFLDEIGMTITGGTPSRYTVANGGSPSCDGTVRLEVEAGSFKLPFEFVVSKEIPLPVIVGKDFMYAADALMEFREGTVVLRGEKDKQKVKVLSVLSETDGLPSGKASECPGRVCAVLATGYQPGLVTLAEEPHRPAETSSTAFDETEPEPERNVRQKIEIEEQTAEPARKDEPVAPALETMLPNFDINPDLTEDQKKALLDLLKEHARAFATSPDDLGHMKGVMHEIDTGQNRPVNQPPRRLPPPKMLEAERQVDSMLRRGIIRNSKSRWASLALLRDKKDRAQRFCVDFRALNALTKKDRYPLPRIDESLDIIGGNKYFSSLDLHAAYWQVAVRPSDIGKTAFTCSMGLFEFVVMPFGLCNAPSTFQRAMDLVLAGVKWRTCLVYIDDVLVFAPTFELHLERLGEVLRRLIHFGLKLKPAKCSFGRQTLSYVGHVVKENRGSDGVENTNKPGDVRSFLGLSSYYRKFIPDYARVARPLTRLLRDDGNFQWMDDCDDAFLALKDSLSSAPILAYPNWDLPFLLKTDASNYAIAAVLSQVHDDGLERVVSYASRVLQDREQRYDTREKELLAVVYGCETFRKYLFGVPFIVITDHANLRWLMSSTKMSGRLAHWVLQLQEFDFEIRHKAGKANRNADALSRLPIVCAIDVVRVPTADEVVANQRRDPQLRAVIDYLAKGGDTAEMPPEVKEVLRDSGEISPGGVLEMLWYTETVRARGAITVPYLAAIDRLDVIRAAHRLPASGHFGRARTFDRVRSQYYWKGMRQDIANYVRTCPACQLRKRSKPVKAGQLQLFSATAPFQMVGIDIAGPFPTTSSGNRYVVVMVDRFTRWVEVAAVPTIDAVTVADVFLTKIIFQHGCPEQLLSDRGAQFTSALLRRLSDRLAITKLFTTAYHPQCNGQVERFNRTLKTALTAFVNEEHSDWDTYIEAVAFAYRTTVMAAIWNTPFYLVHGCDARLPTAVISGPKSELTQDARHYGLEVTKRIRRAFDIARKFQLDADRKRKEHYDRSHHQAEFLPGSLVLLHRPVLSPGIATKMQNKFTGPYRVARRLSDVTYELQNLDTHRPVLSHVQRIVPYFPPELFDANGHARVALNPTPHDGGCVTMDLGQPRRARSTSPVEIERRA